jgi:hypothetical protein
MNVKMSRRDFPLLTEEIARLPKGPRRTNRLAHLATLGLCWERAVSGMEARRPCEQESPPCSPTAAEGAARTNPYCSRLDAGQLAALLDGDGP